MVKGQRQFGNFTNHNFTIDNPRSIHDASYTKNGHFWSIDDRCCPVGTEYTIVIQTECPTAQLDRRTLAIAGFGYQVIDFYSEFTRGSLVIMCEGMYY